MSLRRLPGEWARTADRLATMHPLFIFSKGNDKEHMNHNDRSSNIYHDCSC